MKTTAFFFMLLASLAFPSSVFSGSQHAKTGDVIPQIEFLTPKLDDEKQYLGLDESEYFTLDELNADFFLIEVVGAYCPICHAQSSEINRLFNTINRDQKLNTRMLMLSVASGATEMEIEYLKNSWNAPYPIVGDYEYHFLSAIGNPDVPFTLILSRNGTVKYSHKGRMPELSEFMETIREIVQID